MCVTGPAEEQTQKRIKIGQQENERKIAGREFSENSTAQFFRLRERARVCVWMCPVTVSKIRFFLFWFLGYLCVCVLLNSCHPFCSQAPPPVWIFSVLKFRSGKKKEICSICSICVRVCFPFGCFSPPSPIKQMDDYCRYLVDELHVLYNSWMMMTRPFIYIYMIQNVALAATQTFFSLSLSLLSFLFWILSETIIIYNFVFRLFVCVYSSFVFWKSRQKRQEKSTTIHLYGLLVPFWCVTKSKVSVCNWEIQLCYVRKEH